MTQSTPRGGITFALVLLMTGLLSSPAFADKPASPGNSNGNGKGNSSSSITYSGQATALRVEGVEQPIPGPIVLCETGPLPGSGGVVQSSASNFNYGNGALTIEHASAMAIGNGPEASAESELSGYHAEFISHEGTHVTIDADLIHGYVAATADRQGRISVTSSVQVDNLRIDGRAIVVTGAPNQRIDLPTGGWLIINEQANAASGSGADIAVSPLHFVVCDCIEGHVGLIQAGLSVAGTPPPPEDHDCGKVTGGGWITGTPSGAKGTFGMSGGVRRSEFWGHLTYIDHGTGMDVKSTAVTGFENDPADAKGRIITYAVTINGVAGTARLRVVDNGEPGRNDIFDLTLSNGYHAAGDLGGAHPGGGNIQLHKCPPGWE